MSKVARAILVVISLLLPCSVHAGDEPAVQGEGRILPYLKNLHAKVHRLWADNFLTLASGQLPKDHPINLDTRAVELTLVVTSDGRLDKVTVTKASGAKDFDGAALDVVKSAAPFAAAPPETLSDDGRVHVRWTFARDDRRCSGLAVVHETSDLANALPQLVAQGREAVAIARIQEAPDKEREQAFTIFARAWLDRNEDDKDLALQVAMANAIAGDPRGQERLRNAMERGQAIEMTARGLGALKVPLCAFVKDKLDGASSELRVAVLSALRYGLDGTCIAWAAAIAGDSQAERAERMAAIAALAGHEEPEATGVLRNLLKEKDPSLRAAATLAEARADSGRRALFRLTPQLRDDSIEVRAAAAAAIVRAGGESGLTQLFLLFKEKDSRPYEAVASELARLPGEDSAALLGRILRKDDRNIRLASARALARRSDPAAAKVQASLATSDDAELRFLAGDTQDADKRLAAASAPEGYVWTESYEALVAGNGKLAAVDWAVAHFSKLAPTVRIDVMGAWVGAHRPHD